MREKYLGFTIGIILVAVTIAISLALPKANALQYLTVLLMGIATVYLGFTFSNTGRKQDIIIEMANITMYIVLVLLSIGITPYFLVAGYFWHGVWDIIHHKKVNLVQTKVPEWYIYGCILYDWVIGIFILVWMI
ncbi:Uncharacterised protein [uncultured archaeon]|nr:Uncharacterised protein [uncultured archaeon]